MPRQEHILWTNKFVKVSDSMCLHHHWNLCLRERCWYLKYYENMDNYIEFRDAARNMETGGWNSYCLGIWGGGENPSYWFFFGGGTLTTIFSKSYHTWIYNAFGSENPACHLCCVIDDKYSNYSAQMLASLIGCAVCGSAIINECQGHICMGWWGAFLLWKQTAGDYCCWKKCYLNQIVGNDTSTYIFVRKWYCNFVKCWAFPSLTFKFET